MLLFVSVVLAATPALSIDGKPVPAEEIRYYFTQTVHPVWPRRPEALPSPTGEEELDDLATAWLGERAAEEKGIKLTKDELAKVPKANAKASRDYVFIIQGAPAQLPRTEKEATALKRAFVVDRFVAASGLSKEPTAEDRATALASHPELKTIPEELTVQCLKPPLPSDKESAKKLLELTQQGKPLVEIAKALNREPRFIRTPFVESYGAEQFKKFKATPKAAVFTNGAACELVSSTPARVRTEAELAEAALPFAERLAEDRAWEQLFGPLFAKAKISVDEKQVAQLRASVAH